MPRTYTVLSRGDGKAPRFRADPPVDQKARKFSVLVISANIKSKMYPLNFGCLLIPAGLDRKKL
jgi:hypothetical protein